MSTQFHRLCFGSVPSRVLALAAISGVLAACSGASDSTAAFADKSGTITSSYTQGGPESSTVGAQSVATGREATLEWQSSPDSDVAGYRVYHGIQSRTYIQGKGSGLDAGRVTDYTIKGLQPGSVVYVAVTAYDVVGNESDYSAELSWIVQ